MGHTPWRSWHPQGGPRQRNRTQRAVVGLVGKFPADIFLRNIARAVRPSRSTALLPATFGVGCRCIEIMATGAPLQHRPARSSPN